MEILRFEKESDWLAARTQDITSTDVSALFGLSPYQSKFGLWHSKRSGEVQSIAPNSRMTWGTRLQDAIGRGVCEDLRLVGEPLSYYARIPDLKIGSSFDWYGVGSNANTEYIIEVKNVDGLAFKRGWRLLDDGELIAPPHIELQLQHQLLVHGIQRGIIAALVNGNTVHTLHRERDETVCRQILLRVEEFWASIESDSTPEIDFEKDSDVVLSLARASESGGEIVADASISALVDRYELAKAAADTAEKEVKKLKAEILWAIGDATSVIGDGWRLDARLTGGSSGSVVTQDMVGTTIGSRAPYRAMRVKRTTL